MRRNCHLNRYWLGRNVSRSGIVPHARERRARKRLGVARSLFVLSALHRLVSATFFLLGYCGSCEVTSSASLYPDTRSSVLRTCVKMPHVVQHIREAGVRRRRHPRDYHGSSEGGGDLAMAPNVHNSLAIQKKHVASMYRYIGHFRQDGSTVLGCVRYSIAFPHPFLSALAPLPALAIKYRW